MDGAFYHDQDRNPADYKTDETTFLRPGQTLEPNGTATIRLDGEAGVTKITIPPRSIWRTGKWLGNAGLSWHTWVVSGEGTPGNFMFREYVLPQHFGTHMTPPHPADWSEKDRQGKGYKPVSRAVSAPATPAWKLETPKPVTQQAPTMPFGVKVICPGCGHYFKMNDLGTHAKEGICPAEQGDLVVFIMPCECHDGLQETAQVMPGFPKKMSELAKAPAPVTQATDKAPEAVEELTT